MVDLAPTLLDCAELPAEPQMQGRSFRSILTGEADPSRFRDFVYSEYLNAWTHPDAYATMLRTRDEKIVVYHGRNRASFTILAADPDEFENLWDRPDQTAEKTPAAEIPCDAIAFTADPYPPRLGPF